MTDNNLFAIYTHIQLETRKKITYSKINSPQYVQVELNLGRFAMLSVRHKPNQAFK